MTLKHWCRQLVAQLVSRHIFSIHSVAPLVTVVTHLGTVVLDVRLGRRI